jgi:hypothetical protein
MFLTHYSNEVTQVLLTKSHYTFSDFISRHPNTSFRADV